MVIRALHHGEPPALAPSMATPLSFASVSSELRSATEGTPTLCVVLSSSASAYAQSTARINGRVLDQVGAVLPGASVTVTDASTGVARDTVTNGEGLYSVPALNPGGYDVSASLTGFEMVVRSGITLTVGAEVVINLAP